MKTLLITLCTAGLAVSTAVAQNGESGQGRETREQTRIENGVNSGQLTTKEANRLERKQQRVDARVAKIGTATPGERAADRRILHKQSQRIRAQKHDTNGARTQ